MGSFRLSIAPAALIFLAASVVYAADPLWIDIHSLSALPAIDTPTVGAPVNLLPASAENPPPPPRKPKRTNKNELQAVNELYNSSLLLDSSSHPTTIYTYDKDSKSGVVAVPPNSPQKNDVTDISQPTLNAIAQSDRCQMPTPCLVYKNGSIYSIGTVARGKQVDLVLGQFNSVDKNGKYVDLNKDSSLLQRAEGNSEHIFTQKQAMVAVNNEPGSSSTTAQATAQSKYSPTALFDTAKSESHERCTLGQEKAYAESLRRYSSCSYQFENSQTDVNNGAIPPSPAKLDDPMNDKSETCGIDEMRTQRNWNTLSRSYNGYTFVVDAASGRVHVYHVSVSGTTEIPAQSAGGNNFTLGDGASVTINCEPTTGHTRRVKTCPLTTHAYATGTPKFTDCNYNYAGLGGNSETSDEAEGPLSHLSAPVIKIPGVTDPRIPAMAQSVNPNILAANYSVHGNYEFVVDTVTGQMKAYVESANRDRKNCSRYFKQVQMPKERPTGVSQAQWTTQKPVGNGTISLNCFNRKALQGESTPGVQ